MKRVITRQNKTTITWNADEVIKNITEGKAQYAVMSENDPNPCLLVFDYRKNKIIILQANNLRISSHSSRNADIESYIKDGVLFQITLKIK
jgi:hypothetical protein